MARDERLPSRSGRMENGAPSHRLLFGGGASPRHVGGPRRELSRAGASSNLGPSLCPYSPECLEKLSEKPRRGLQRSPAGSQRGGILVLFAILTPARFTLGVLLVPLFGQFLEGEVSEAQNEQRAQREPEIN